MMKRKDAMYGVLLGGARNTVARVSWRPCTSGSRTCAPPRCRAPAAPAKRLTRCERLVEAIAARDAPAPQALCEAHVHNAAETALGVLEASGGASQA